MKLSNTRTYFCRHADGIDEIKFKNDREFFVDAIRCEFQMANFWILSTKLSNMDKFKDIDELQNVYVKVIADHVAELFPADMFGQQTVVYEDPQESMVISSLNKKVVKHTRKVAKLLRTGKYEQYLATKGLPDDPEEGYVSMNEHVDQYLEKYKTEVFEKCNMKVIEMFDEKGIEYTRK